MTEINERITALETKMEYTLNVLSKREEYQTSVLKSLTIIEMKQDQSLNYQKTCDAERSAQGTRIGQLENVREIEKNFRRTLRTQAGAIGSVAAFIVSLVTVYSLVKH